MTTLWPFVLAGVQLAICWAGWLTARAIVRRWWR